MSAWLLSLIAIATVALSLLSGFRRGFVRQLPRLAGLLFGIVCAHIFREPLQQHLMQGFPFEQGRTETWTNSIPRYLMLHVAYKLTLGMAASKKDNVWDSGEL